MNSPELVQAAALILVLMTQKLPIHFASSTGGDAITIHLVEAVGRPAPSIEVSLTLFDTAEFPPIQIMAGSCVPDAEGSCRIDIADPPRDQAGFIRGELSIASGSKRSITWVGGNIEVDLILDEHGSIVVHRQGTANRAEDQFIATSPEDSGPSPPSTPPPASQTIDRFHPTPSQVPSTTPFPQADINTRPFFGLALAIFLPLLFSALHVILRRV